MTIGADVLKALPPRPYAEVREQVQDGDILLCSAADWGSLAIRWATRSQWSHVAIAFRLPEVDRVVVLECVERIGVRAVPLSGFIARTSSGTEPYPGSILLARHQAMAAVGGWKSLREMSTFAFGRLGDRFSNLETAKIALRICLGRFDTVLPPVVAPDDEFICSEYVARCFERIGIRIKWDGLGFIAPSDFADDPAIGAVAQIQT